MPNTLGGLMVPLVSPFDSAGELARDRYLRHVRYFLDLGVSGLVVAGSSGEAALLDEDERARLVAWAREATPAERWVIAGTGAESTRLAVRRARDAAREGADAVLIVAPHYYQRRMSDAALDAHFRRIADESPLPVLLYNVPAYAHLVLSPSLVSALAAHPNVIGMKDSAGNLPVLAEYLQAQDDGFRVLTGNGQTTRDALEMGASGAIVAVALFAAPLVVELERAARAGDDAAARALQARLTPLAKTIVAELGPPGLKAAMDVVGLEGGAPRAPLLPLDEAERARVAAALAECEVPAAEATYA
jgi:4-hydroxy-2-oxoglutarate aldolase